MLLRWGICFCVSQCKALPKVGQAGCNAAFHFLKLLPMTLPIMLLPDFRGSRRL